MVDTTFLKAFLIYFLDPYNDGRSSNLSNSCLKKEISVAYEVVVGSPCSVKQVGMFLDRQRHSRQGILSGDGFDNQILWSKVKCEYLLIKEKVISPKIKVSSRSSLPKKGLFEVFEWVK